MQHSDFKGEEWTHLKGEEWTHLKDLKEYRIGSISGYAYPSDFEQADFLQKMEMTVTNGTLIKMLAAGRLDLIIGDEHVLAVEAANEGLSGQFKQAGPALETVKRYIAVPKSKTTIASTIENALKTFQETPQYQNILNKYR
ncbi:substrate-binding periplasmic protein [Kiloniella sp.]|uniref:substrate-binding periplasmic protein n=1 Tax=Kiloniella sp. TaxID=1938587 RepID=UPI003B02C5ED